MEQTMLELTDEEKKLLISESLKCFVVENQDNFDDFVDRVSFGRDMLYLILNNKSEYDYKLCFEFFINILNEKLNNFICVFGQKELFLHKPFIYETSKNFILYFDLYQKLRDVLAEHICKEQGD